MIKTKKLLKIGAYVGFLLLCFCSMFIGMFGGNINKIYAEATQPLYNLVYMGPDDTTILYTDQNAIIGYWEESEFKRWEWNTGKEAYSPENVEGYVFKEWDFDGMKDEIQPPEVETFDVSVFGIWLEILETPTDLRWDISVQGDAIATWGEVEHAIGYDITLYDSDGYIEVSDTGIDDYFYDFGEVFVSKKCSNYYFTVKAIGDSSYADSEISQSETWSSYQVTFDSKGGSEIAPLIVIGGQLVTKPSPDPTKDGFEFDCWGIDGEEWEFDVDTVTDELTLEAYWEAEQYTITYYDVGETDNIAFTGNHGENYPTTHTYGTATTLVNPTKDGYIFAGWYTNYSGEGTAVTTLGATDYTANIKLYAKWNETYTVTYEAGTVYTGAPVDLSEDVTVLPDPLPTLTQEGYNFEGWYTDEELTTPAVAGATISANTTLYAKWTAVVYTITFNANGGNGEMSSQEFTYGIAENLKANEFTRNGYTFKGWATTEGGSKEYDNGESYTIGVGNVTLYAVWTANTYSITYNLNGGTNNASNPATYTIEQTPIILLDPTKTGYTFDGWYDNAGFTGSAITEIVLGSTDDVTLYAKWTLDTYSVTYVEGAVHTGAPAVDLTDVTALPDPLPTLTQTGYTFDGWFTDAGLTTPAVAGATISANTTLYAKWTAEEYTITYNLDGGTNNASNPATYTIEQTPIILLDPTKTGYTFDGWYDNAGFTGSAITEIVLGSTGDVTLYAKWNEAYTVTYEAGTVYTGAPVDLSEDVTVLPDPLPTLTQEGYNFEGWYTDEELTTPAVAGATISDNTTLYAKWAIIQYTITYNLNDGNNNSNNPSTYTIETATISLLDPTREGYEFVGWYEGDTKVTKILLGSTGNKTLEARWIQIFTITYNLNGGTNSSENPATYTEEDEEITLEDATKTGYDFVGWYGYEDFEGDAITKIEKGSTGNKTFYAKFVPIQYTITYNLNGGENNLENSATYTIETATIIFKDATGEHTFAGWYDNEDYEGEAITGIEIGSTGNIELYAKWTKAATLIIDGEEETGSIVVGKEFTHLSKLTAIKTGYTLTGWIYNDEVVDEETVFNYDEEIELTAQFEANNYVITFDLDGGDALEEDTINVTYDAAVGELPTPEKDGYTFLGWYYGETEVTAETLYQYPEDITLTAVWEESGFDWITLSYVVSGTIVLVLILAVLFIASDSTKYKKKNKGL